MLFLLAHQSPFLPLLISTHALAFSVSSSVKVFKPSSMFIDPARSLTIASGVAFGGGVSSFCLTGCFGSGQDFHPAVVLDPKCCCLYPH